MLTRVYEPLNGAQNGIRVVRVAPYNSFGRNPVVCQLEETTWDACEYEALSYCWGKQNDHAIIQLGGEPFKVTKDLAAALEQLCLPDRIRTIWVLIASSPDMSAMANSRHRLTQYASTNLTQKRRAYR